MVRQGAPASWKVVRVAPQNFVTPAEDLISLGIDSAGRFESRKNDLIR